MLSKIWNTTLITTKSGFFISVEGIMLVLVSMLGGYLLSRLTEFFLARRLANSKIQRPALRGDAHAKNEALSALLALGYKPMQAEKVIKQVYVEGMTSEQAIRESLRAMS